MRAALLLFWCIAGLVMLPSCRCDTGGSSSADGPRTAIPSMDVAKVPNGAIHLDGSFGDDGWEDADVTPAFVAPGNGDYLPDSPVNAKARMAWSDEALYLGIEVEDGDPSSPFSRDEVDPHVWAGGSGIELMLQPGDPGDNRHYYEVQVDVNGAVWDTRFDDYNRPITGSGQDKRFGHQSWKSEIRRGVAIDRTAGTYRIELELPWRALSSDRTAIPPKTGDVWRANLYSFRDGQRHALAWSPIMGEGNFHRASRFGKMQFVER